MNHINDTLLKFHIGELDMYDYYDLYKHTRALYLLNKSKYYIQKHYSINPNNIDLYLDDSIVCERILSVGYNSYEMEQAYSASEILDIVSNKEYNINSIGLNTNIIDVYDWINLFKSNGYTVDNNSIDRTHTPIVILRKKCI